ncbi:hypothetical protein TBK1r_30430 [Stieleria magnilauensis]|uniref:Uncharacterized protein n=1 Tax=Stieleria magnilauensis TaxID=2527963 RepID=A0ABX5XQ12_9BACT|nr:hypothetical protein TBK1r_30430 [Planctomycetes bacterium TBK1r]
MTAGEPVGDSLRALAEQTSCRLKVDRASRSRLTSLSLVAVTFALLDKELGILPRTVLIGLRPRRRCCSLALGATLILRSLSPPPSTVGSARSIPPSLRSAKDGPLTFSNFQLLLFQLGTWNLKPETVLPLPAIVLRRTSCPRRVSVDGHPTRRAFGVLSCPKVRGRSCGKTKRPPIAAEVNSVL